MQLGDVSVAVYQFVPNLEQHRQYCPPGFLLDISHGPSTLQRLEGPTKAESTLCTYTVQEVHGATLFSVFIKPVHDVLQVRRTVGRHSAHDMLRITSDAKRVHTCSSSTTTTPNCPAACCSCTAMSEPLVALQRPHYCDSCLHGCAICRTLRAITGLSVALGREAEHL